MSRDEIIKMARECGYWSGQTVEMNDVGLERFAILVAAAEREACAQVAEDSDHIVDVKGYYAQLGDAAATARNIAAAIRARGAA